MKKILIAIILFAGSFNQLIAQPADKDVEGLEALKIAFLSKQMNLTPDEAQKFWPVYNQYVSEFRKMRREHTGDELELREKSLNLVKKYKPEFVKCVGPDKFNRMLKSEGDWRQVVKDELIRRRQLKQQLKRNKPGQN